MISLTLVPIALALVLSYPAYELTSKVCDGHHFTKELPWTLLGLLTAAASGASLAIIIVSLGLYGIGGLLG